MWRLSKGLSQELLAAKAGIPRPNLSAIEKGGRNITVATLRALSFALGIRPGLLVDGIAPAGLNKGGNWPRELLENISRTSLGATALAVDKLNPKDKAVSGLLSKITKNRINAQKKIYKNTIKSRKDYINSWLMLKSGIGKEVVGNLLARQEKMLKLKINE